MPVELRSLDRLSPAVREPVRRYAEQVAELAGPQGLGLTLYGAIAAGTFDAARHVIHNVLVLETVDLDLVRRLGSELSHHHVSRIAPPLVLTPAYIQASLDTFPLELIEIQQQHATLWGEDHFAGLQFDNSHIRLQCERELKVMLLATRQTVLHAAGQEKKITAAAQHAGDGVLRTLRGLLWLQGQRTAQPASQVIEQIEKLVSRSLPGVRALIDERVARDWRHIRELYDDLDALTNLSDAWQATA